MLPRPLWYALLLACTGGAPVAQGNVWIVDDDPGPGVHFGDVAPAVAAASDFDLIVVRAGEYGRFTVIDKTLTIVGQGEAFIRSQLLFETQPPVWIASQSASKSIVLRNLNIITNQIGDPLNALQIGNCQGSVLVEDCDVSSSIGHGALVESSSAVTFQRCTLVGRNLLDAFIDTWLPRAGLFALNSDVYVFDTTVTGGYGGNAIDPLFSPPPTPPGDGGPGLQIFGGTLLAVGSTLIGGTGGSDTTASVCLAAGDGGTGLRMDATLVRLLDTQLLGGAGGVTDCAAPAGVPGPPSVVTSGTIEDLPGTARSFAWESPVDEDALFAASYTGAPGDFVWILLTLRLGPDDYLEGFGSALLIDPAFIVVALGTVPPSGTLEQTYVAVDTGLLPHVPLVAQGAFLDTSFGFSLSGPSSLAILGDGADD